MARETELRHVGETKCADLFWVICDKRVNKVKVNCCTKAVIMTNLSSLCERLGESTVTSPLYIRVKGT